jgi:hypothetical protein
VDTRFHLSLRESTRSGQIHVQSVTRPTGRAWCGSRFGDNLQLPIRKVATHLSSKQVSVPNRAPPACLAVQRTVIDFSCGVVRAAGPGAAAPLAVSDVLRTIGRGQL